MTEKQIVEAEVYLNAKDVNNQSYGLISELGLRRIKEYREYVKGKMKKGSIIEVYPMQSNKSQENASVKISMSLVNEEELKKGIPNSIFSTEDGFYRLSSVNEVGLYANAYTMKVDDFNRLVQVVFKEPFVSFVRISSRFGYDNESNLRSRCIKTGVLPQKLPIRGCRAERSLAEKYNTSKLKNKIRIFKLYDEFLSDQELEALFD